MFGLFKKPRFDGSYHPKERMIFRYFDGQKEIIADPMILHKRIMEKGPTLAIRIKVATSQSKDAVQEHNALIGNIREIFSVKPLAEGGLTEVETAELLDTFLTYVDSLKKNTKASAILPKATSPISETALAASPAMPNTSATGSTATEPSTSEAASSPSASV